MLSLNRKRIAYSINCDIQLVSAQNSQFLIPTQTPIISKSISPGV
jgi:hypothetical protein